MQYIDIFLQHYGWQGTALAAVILILLCVQLYYFAVVYTRIPRYRNSSRRKIEQNEVAVSVIVPMFSEDLPFLEETLPQLLAQEYATFEIVVVYVGHDMDFFADLQRYSLTHPNLITTRIDFSPRFPISPKMAINVGIKSAHYEHLILTTSEARPASEKWLALMGKGFTRGHIVLGYCGVDAPHGLGGYLMRTWRMMGSTRWLAQAMAGHPYRGIRQNLGFTKQLYFNVRGFSNLNMNIGEDDLFVQQIATPENVSIVISPRAAMCEKSWGGLHWWIQRERYFMSAEKLYPRRARTFRSWDLGSRLLLWVACVTALVFMPFEYKIAAAAVVLLRYLWASFTVLRISRRLGEQGMAGRYFLYDFAEPFLHILMRLLLVRKDSKVWR